MNIRAIDWTRIEKIVIFVSLFVFLLYQSLSMLFPELLSSIPPELTTVFLGTSLLASIHYVIRMLEKPLVSPTFIRYASFSEAMISWLSDRDRVRDLRVLAYTSKTFLEHLRLQPRNFGRVKVLLYHPSDDSRASSSEQASLDTPANLLSTLAEWEILVSEGRIRSLQVRILDSHPSFFFGLVRRESLILGLLWPRNGNRTDYEPRETFVLHSSSAGGNRALRLAYQWFDERWAVAQEVLFMGDS